MSGITTLRRCLVFAAIGEVRVEEHQAGHLTLAAGRRLERDGVEPGELTEDRLQLPFELERALRGVVLDERVQARESGQADQPLVDARVVLHRARAERVEAGVDPEVAGREGGEVAQHLGLGELGEPRRRRASLTLGQLGDRQVGPRHRHSSAARLRLLVDQLHEPSASARRSISATVRFSVTATSSESSRPA